MAKKVLITGAAGFFGRHMRTYLLGCKEGLEIICTDLTDNSPENSENFIKGDISNEGFVCALIDEVRPDVIIHLAGIFRNGNNQEIYAVNILSMTAIMEAVIKYTPDSPIVAAGSAAEYGLVNQKLLPITEDFPCNPVTPYGMSKLTATQIALYYNRLFNTNVMIVRPFQLLGKGLTNRLAPGAFAEQIQNAITSASNVIRVGNLESYRDFLDVRDACRAVWMLSQKPAPKEIFNICSQVPVKISDLLEEMVNASGANIKIEVDSTKLRGNTDVRQVYGSYKKLNMHCGWKPQISLRESILYSK
ncbi:MAG: NAD-dependent epimerase/dehydratase family protein [Planctomycetota bacterium]|jgi:GDP-4-dehydro-6-deoxy-D-mannose reductase